MKPTNSIIQINYRSGNGQQQTRFINMNQVLFCEPTTTTTQGGKNQTVNILFKFTDGSEQELNGVDLNQFMENLGMPIGTGTLQHQAASDSYKG